MCQLSLSNGKIYFYSSLALSLYFSFFTFVTNSVRAEVSSYSESAYTIPRQIQYSFTLQNRSNCVLQKAEFWTYAPVKHTSTQRCIQLETSHPYELISDELGNQILYFTFNNFPPFATKIITIRADLMLSDQGKTSPGKDVESFLNAAKYIESDNPELSEFAKRFKVLKPSETAKKIFHWVAANLQYMGYLKDDYGALYAFKNRRGDCTEFMYLFAALCRANFIPSRGIGGYVCNENSIVKPNDYHNWAEFYEDDIWHLADPQKKVFMENPSQYIAMRIIGKSSNNPMGEFHRFRCAGEGLIVKMNKD